MLFKLSEKVIGHLLDSEKWEHLENTRFYKLNSHKFSSSVVSIDSNLSEFNFDFIIDAEKMYVDNPEEFITYTFDEKKLKTLQNSIKRYIKLGDDVKNSDTLYKVIKNLPDAIRSYVINEKVNGNEFAGYFMLQPSRFYEMEKSDILCVLKDVEYSPSTKYKAYDSVVFKFTYQMHGEVDILTREFSHIGKNGVTLSQIFDAIGAFQIVESDFKEYSVKLEKYNKIISTCEAYDINGEHTIITRKKDRHNDYRYSKKVLDFDSKDGQSIGVSDLLGYRKEVLNKEKSTKHNHIVKPFGLSDLDKDNPYYVDVPNSLKVPVFLISDHIWAIIHVDFLDKHIYKGIEFMDNLVIPDEQKTIIKMLIESNKLKLNDIIAGKSGGTFVLSIGSAGIGKTLTAEVVSEAIGLPLYKVQCSQLGVSPDNIEENLEYVMDNAKRWNAILLIDEADVYIRERGSDIEQNAVVGVFLRILEYSNNITFMTTNIPSIDDAILSRATAIVQYSKPTGDDAFKIFSILCKNFDIQFSDIDRQEEFIKFFKENNFSGRDIKSILKLVKMKITNEKLSSASMKDLVLLNKYVTVKNSDALWN